MGLEQITVTVFGVLLNEDDLDKLGIIHRDVYYSFVSLINKKCVEGRHSTLDDNLDVLQVPNRVYNKWDMGNKGSKFILKHTNSRYRVFYNGCDSLDTHVNELERAQVLDFCKEHELDGNSCQMHILQSSG